MVLNKTSDQLEVIKAWPDSLDELLIEYGEYSQRHRDLCDETVKLHHFYLKRFFTRIHVTTSTELFSWLSFTTIQEYCFSYKEEFGHGSQKNMHFALRSFFRFCKNKQYIRTDLSSAVPAIHTRRLSQVPRGIDSENISLLLGSIDQSTPVGLRDFSIIQLLSVYGIRGVQIRRLTLKNIDWHNDRIFFPSAKGGKSVVEPLLIEVGNALLSYIQKGRPTITSYNEVFLTSNEPFRPFFTAGSLSGMIARRLRSAQITLLKTVSVGTHSFRHAFASRMVGHVPLKHISDMLGHRDPISTLIYTKIDFKSLQEASLEWPEEEEQ